MAWIASGKVPAYLGLTLAFVFALFVACSGAEDGNPGTAGETGSGARTPGGGGTAGSDGSGSGAACPKSCDDGKACTCTVDTASGSADDCTRRPVWLMFRSDVTC